MPKYTKWEYLFATTQKTSEGHSWLIGEPAYPFADDTKAIDVLNTLGQDGWELASSAYYDPIRVTTHILKRAIAD